MKRLAIIAALAVSVLASGCGEPKSVLLKRPESAETNSAVTDLWTSEIAKVAQDGDWILSRSYYMTSDAIATFSGGEDLSHASIYDAKRGTIIESIGSGVREIPLRQLVDRNAHLIVVHPSGMTEQQRSRAVERARSRMGQKFDYGAVVGLGSEDRVYCSELVWWASQVELRTGAHERVITPSELMDYGQVVYWSGERDDSTIQESAVDWDNARVAKPKTVAAK